MSKTEYEVACALTRDPTPFVGEDNPEDTRRELAAELQEALARLVQAAGPSPQRLAILIGRAAGLSYAEIGARYSVSKQAIAKHVNMIERLNTRLGTELHSKQATVAVALAGENVEIVADRTKLASRIRELKKCLQRQN